MQSFLQKIHIYGGLACFWYLIILGISSLQFNHHFEFMRQQGDSIKWQRQVSIVDPVRDNLKLAEAIRDSLNLMGWPLPWEMWRDSTHLYFAMEQPAKRYFIKYTFTSNTANIVETNKGFWHVFNSLHGAGAVPNGPFTTLWQWYTRATVITLILSIVTGIYIYLNTKEEKKAGLIVLFASVGGTLLWMIKLYLWG